MTRAVSIAQGGSNNVTMRNRIINGAMMIDQRNAGAVVTITDSLATYTTDRWQVFENGSMSFTAQQSSTTPTGFSKSLLVTSTAAVTPGAASRSALTQIIEGFNIADLSWGTAGASSVTLSFWVRSSLTGQFGGALQNAAQDYSYPFAFTINSANTFEYKTITIAGPTTGTWNSDNTGGVRVSFDLGMGSDLLGTAGAWTVADKRGATGDTRINGTNGATFYITGVQLEAGTTATPFEQRLYGTELALCQRYFWNVLPSQGTACYVGGVNVAGATASGLVSIPYPVPMRTAPALSTTGSTIYVDNFALNGSAPVANISLNMSTANVARVYFTNVTVSGGSYSLSQAFNTIVGYGGNTGGLLFSAEL